jgi:phosphoribosylanthranilate isomerase
MIIRTKICGLKTKDAVEAADGAGAAFLGFVFCEKSPRYVTPALAAEISADAVAAKVAVVVDASDELLNEIVAHLQPDFIQLHGKETEARAAEIKLRYANIGLIKAFPAHSSLLTAHLESSKQKAVSIYEYILLDSPQAGSGKQFDYSNFTPPAQDNWFLSGGLTPKNVAEAIAQTGAKMVDVSSGVESERGVKDIAKIEAFLEITNSI